MKKRVLLCLLALLCAVVMLTFTISAEELSGICGENLTWTLKDGTLTISGEGPMAEDSDMQWWDYRKEIKHVIIEDGVTAISHSAFSNLQELTSVTIPESVCKIGSYAFNYCVSLTSVTLPDGITELEQSSFARCSGLTEIKLPAELTVIGNSVFDPAPV